MIDHGRIVAQGTLDEIREPARARRGRVARGRVPEARAGGRAARGPVLDRLIALVALRCAARRCGPCSARARGSRTLLVALPGARAALARRARSSRFSGVRLLERSRPELVLPALSALAGAARPVLGALAAAGGGRRDGGARPRPGSLHYPAPLATLVASSLLANLGQPLVLAQLLPLAAVALALAGRRPALAAGLRGALALASASRSPRAGGRARAARPLAPPALARPRAARRDRSRPRAEPAADRCC